MRVKCGVPLQPRNNMNKVSGKWVVHEIEFGDNTCSCYANINMLQYSCGHLYSIKFDTVKK